MQEVRWDGVSSQVLARWFRAVLGHLSMQSTLPLKRWGWWMRA